jgi:hypothetical protein
LQEYAGIAKIKAIVERSRLSHPFEQWCIAYAATSQWKDVAPPLLSLLKDTFQGWTQTRVNEKANKVWRDVGNRDNASGVASSVTLWDKLTTLNVLAEFGRNEIEVQEGESLPRNEMEATLQGLFKDPSDRVKCGDQAIDAEKKAMEEENSFLATFDEILHDRAKGFTPESEQVLVAEMRLLRLLNEHNLWNRANDAWQTALLPIGALVRAKSMAQVLWILKTNECAALCWPAIEVDKGVWAKSKKLKELVWYTCFNIDEVEVFNVKVCSPMHLRLKDLHIA